jgi:hypothetical protein
MNQRVQSINDAQDVFLGVAWVLPAEKRLFQLFPYIVHMDGVEDTNKEKQTLFTAAAHDANGHICSHSCVPFCQISVGRKSNVWERSGL